MSNPDGPRGPRRQVQIGLIMLASRTALPIILVGVGYSRCWRLKSWDGFFLPKPFSRVHMRSALMLPEEFAGDRDEAAARLQERLRALNPDRVPSPYRPREKKRSAD